MDRIDVLTRRLVTGAISLEAYKCTLKKRFDQNYISKEEYFETINRLNITDDDFSCSANYDQTDTNILSSIDEELFIYKTHIRHFKQNIPFDKIRSVRGIQYTDTLNFVPMTKMSEISIKLDNNDYIGFNEERTIMGLKRHNAIMKTLSILSSLTLDYRENDFFDRLDRAQSLQLKQDMFEGKYPEIILHADGTLTSLDKSVNIKKAYTDGVIGFGTKDIKFFARSSSYTANEIVVSETKGLFGKFVPKEGIEFVPLTEDPDVVRAAIAWYARDF